MRATVESVAPFSASTIRPFVASVVLGLVSTLVLGLVLAPIKPAQRWLVRARPHQPDRSQDRMPAADLRSGWG
jgi:hypothetical protein